MFPEQRLSTLIVDDDPDVVDFIEHVLLSANCEVHAAKDGEQALQRADACRPDLVFLDIHIPEQDGWLVCSKLKLRPQAPTIVLITGYAEAKMGRFAEFVHADEVLRKPFSEKDVQSILDALVAQR